MSYASYAAELLDQVIADSQPDEALFRLILQSMYLLEHISPWLAVRHLELRLLELQGYGVQLDTCLNCGAPLNGERFYGVQGGALCPFCSHGQQGGAALTLEALTTLKSFDFMPLHRLGWVYCSQEGRQSLEGYMELQLQQVLNWRLKSRDFLKQMDL
jgi:DNA repair protein RecO